MPSPGFRLLAGAALAVAACTNDYDEFDFTGRPATDASAQGGSSGSTQGTGGSAGTAAGTAGSGGSGATTDGGGTGGSAVDGGGTGGSGGTAVDGGGAGGSGGTGGSTGGTGGTCDTTERANCGSCGNDCEQQGLGAGFECMNQLCSCTGNSQCGQGPSARCGMTSRRCFCNNTQCRPGEACSFGGNCSCNGGPSCDDGEVCCQNPPGCRASCGS
jgi:hypothetical protein